MKTTLKSLKSRILLNFSSEKDTGFKYRSIIKNIDALCKEGYDLENRLALGLNIYSKEIRYDIFKVIKEFNIKFLRISLVAPNNCQ